MIELPKGLWALWNKYCWCGQPALVWIEVQRELERCDVVGVGKRALNTGLEYMMAYVLDSIDLTEHDGSVGGARLTEEGREVLAFLRRYGVEWEDAIAVMGEEWEDEDMEAIEPLKQWTIRCLKCEKDITSAVGMSTSMKTGEVHHSDPWEAPAGAVVFDGGWNYGSTLYDSMMPVPDNVFARIVVCDGCLVKAKEKGTLKEIPVKDNKS